MTAPALIALAEQIADRRALTAVADLAALLRHMRPDLAVETAFLRGRGPTLSDVVASCAGVGCREAVAVPLVLAGTSRTAAEVASAAEAAARANPLVEVRTTDALGLRPSFLDGLDRRLRSSLRQARVRELDGLVLAGAGSDDPLANQALNRIARLWGVRHRLPTIAAFSSPGLPKASEAVRRLRSAGRRHVAVGSLFLTPGPLVETIAERAFEAGAVAVSEPLGADDEVARTVLARYAVGAVQLVPV